MGNLFSDSLATIFEHEVRRSIASRTDLLRRGDCSECRYFRLCHGGCPMASWQYYRDYQQRTFWCAGLRMIFGRIEELFGHAPREAAQ